MFTFPHKNLPNFLFDISELRVQEFYVTNFNHILYTPN